MEIFAPVSSSHETQTIQELSSFNSFNLSKIMHQQRHPGFVARSFRDLPLANQPTSALPASCSKREKLFGYIALCYFTERIVP